MKDLSITDIQEIINKDESRTLELKETTGELNKAMSSACAFLNSDGGWVMFGITPKLKIVGQQVTDNTKKEIANFIRKIEPSVNVAVQYVELPDKEDFYTLLPYILTRPLSLVRRTHMMAVPITNWRVRHH